MSRRLTPFTFRRTAASAAVVAAAASLVGCAAADHDHSPATQPAVATDVDPQRADPQFWLDQTPLATVSDNDFDRLWNAAIGVSQDYLFPIDRRDRRGGLLTTVPVVSAQWFEPWRRELQTTADVAQSSVATVRRTILWSFVNNGGRYSVTPKVLIERESFTESRVSGLLSRAYFHPTMSDKVYGNRETDRNLILPGTYFYPIGRDFALEQKLVSKVEARLKAVAVR